MPPLLDYLRVGVVRLACWLVGVPFSFYPAADNCDGNEPQTEEEEVDEIENDWLRVAQQRIRDCGEFDPELLTKDDWEAFLDDCWLDGLCTAIASLEHNLRAKGIGG